MSNLDLQGDIDTPQDNMKEKSVWGILQAKLRKKKELRTS